jgi:hypothetical protein
MAGKFAKYIPLIGTVVSCAVSYGACIHFLRHELDLIEKDAHTLKDCAMIARSATTSTSGNDTADAPAELIPIIKTLLCRYFFFSRIICATRDEAMDSAGYDGHSMGEVIPIIHKSCNEKLVSENQNYL